MEPDIALLYLQRGFEYYNKHIFGNQLPTPKLKISNSKTRLGQLSYKRKIGKETEELYDFTLSISNYYQLTDDEVNDIIIHEMIHYFIAHKRLKDTSQHGIIFRKMMDKINHNFNRNITISVRIPNLKPRVQQPPTNYLILAIITKDGKHFLSSVNPTAAGTLSQSIARNYDIMHHAWYQTQDEYFRKFPRVRSLRGKQVSAETYTMITNKMKLLKE